MANFAAAPVHSERYVEALIFAAENHRFQVRKNGSPYLAHLQAVASLVWELGGNEDEAIAAIVHDFPEDIHSDDPKKGLAIIEEQFGAEVAAIVRGCTELNKAADWKDRKLAYIEQVKNGSKSVKLVSFSDKFHNLLADLTEAMSWETNESQKNIERKYWFLSQYVDNADLRSCDRLRKSGAILRYQLVLEDLKKRWGLVSNLEKLQAKYKESCRLAENLKELGERLAQESWDAICQHKRDLVGDVDVTIYEMEYVWLSDEFAGVDCDPSDNPPESNFYFAAVLKSEEPCSPIVRFSGWRSGTILALKDGSEIEKNSITVGWGSSPELAKDDLVQRLANRL